MKPLPEAMIDVGARAKAIEQRCPHKGDFNRCSGRVCGLAGYCNISVIASDKAQFSAGYLAALRVLLERGPSARMKKACGVYEAVAADVLRAQLTQLIAELEGK